MHRPVSEAHDKEMRRRSERRIHEAITKLGSCNMNDTKWREVFELIKGHRPLQAILAVKLIGEEHVLRFSWFSEVGRGWVDTQCGPFWFRLIESLECVGDAAAELHDEIASLGKLPLLKVAGGFRLVAYGAL